MQKRNLSPTLTLVILQSIIIVCCTFLILRLRCTITQKLENQYAHLLFSVVSNEFERTLKKSELDLKNWALELEKVEYEDPCNTPSTILIENNPLYRNYAYINKDGEFVCSQIPFKEGETFKNRINRFEEFKNHPTLKISEFGIGASGDPRIAAWYPILDSNNQFQGAVALGIRLDTLNEMISNLNLPDNTQVLITDLTGAIEVSYPLNGDIIGERKFSAEIFNKILSQNSGTMDVTNEDGNTIFYIYEPIKLNDIPLNFILFGINKTRFFPIYHFTFLPYLVHGIILICISLTIAILIKLFRFSKKNDKR